MIIRLVAIIALLVLNGFFVAAEFALVRSRRARLEAMARAGDAKARMALRAAANLTRVLSAVQLGVTLASLGLGALAEDALGAYLTDWLQQLPLAMSLSFRAVVGTTVAIAVVTFFHVVFGELTPKGWALTHPENVARWLVPPLLLFAWLTTPLTALLTRASMWVLRAFRLRTDATEESVHSPEELRILVEQSQQGGVLGPQDADFIEGVFEFSEKTAREVMTPRTDVDALPVDASLDETLALIEQSHHSRYPVYEDSIDDIVGIVLAKDLLPVLHARPVDFSLRSIVRPVHVVPGTRDVEEVLADFKRLKEHMAVVLDEYGGTAGVVTMEDLLEEIVGEIFDEYDESVTPAEPASGEDVCIPGSMHIGELNERFALEVPEGDYTTVGGFVFSTLGRLPTVGDRVVASHAIFSVRAMDGRRIETLAVDLHSLGDRRATERAGE